MLQPNCLSVDIAIHRPQRFNCSQLPSHHHIAHVAGMPYLVDLREKVQYSFGEIAMGVGEDADAGHEGKGNERQGMQAMQTMHECTNAQMHECTKTKNA